MISGGSGSMVFGMAMDLQDMCRNLRIPFGFEEEFTTMFVIVLFKTLRHPGAL